MDSVQSELENLLGQIFDNIINRVSKTKISFPKELLSLLENLDESDGLFVQSLTDNQKIILAGSIGLLSLLKNLDESFVQSLTDNQKTILAGSIFHPKLRKLPWHPLKPELDKYVSAQIGLVSSMQSEILRLKKEFPNTKEVTYYEAQSSDPADITKEIIAFIKVQQGFEKAFLEKGQIIKLQLLWQTFQSTKQWSEIQGKIIEHVRSCSLEKLILSCTALNVVLESFKKEYQQLKATCRKLKKFKQERLPQELLKILRKNNDVSSLQAIYENICTTEEICSLKSCNAELELYSIEYYKDLVKKVCIIRSFDLIREQFKLAENQPQHQASSLDVQKNEAFLRFQVQFTKDGETKRFFPIAPCELQFGEDIRYVDLCTVIESLLCYKKLSSEDITDDIKWNAWIDELLECDIKEFSYVPAVNNAKTVCLEPKHIKPFTKEDLSELKESIADVIPTRHSFPQCRIM